MDTGGVGSMGDATAALLAAVGMLDDAAPSFDPAEPTTDELVTIGARLARTGRIIDALYAHVAAELIARNVHTASADATPADHLARTTGVDTATARRALHAATAITAQPVLHDATMRGDVSLTHATKIASITAHTPDAAGQLIAAAQHGTTTLNDTIAAIRATTETPTERRARHRRDRSLHLWTDADGMTSGRFRLPPEEGGQFRAVLAKHTDRIFRADTRLTHHQAAADALIHLATSGEGATIDVQMAIIIDLDALRRGDTFPGERCEIPGVGPVNATWARHHYGDAFINLLITHGRDVRTVARPGHRYLTPHLRTALLVAGHECVIHDCTRRGYLERDHHIAHAQGGPTTYDNLNWLCTHHHRKKTNGWTLGPPQPDTGKRTLTPPHPHPRE